MSHRTEGERRIDEALAATDRWRFLPEELRGRAGEDRPLPIGHGQTNSQPTTVRNMLALLDVHSVTVVWVKGHAGHPENERCDRLAVAQTAKHAGI